ncbi:hypothetical protein [Bacillus carboniphilus]|uniref:hypothetical protein n=1 Tax=Bacillus carboniphilus TaxID=86663 RepID=UPI0031D3E383
MGTELDFPIEPSNRLFVNLSAGCGVTVIFSEVSLLFSELVGCFSEVRAVFSELTRLFSELVLSFSEVRRAFSELEDGFSELTRSEFLYHIEHAPKWRNRGSVTSFSPSTTVSSVVSKEISARVTSAGVMVVSVVDEIAFFVETASYGNGYTNKDYYNHNTTHLTLVST